MNRLKELREDKDLFQKDIADYLKIDQSNYSKYELEKISIPLEYLKMLADFYNTSVDYILYRTDQRKPYPTSIMKNNDLKWVIIFHTKIYYKDSLIGFNILPFPPS